MEGRECWGWGMSLCVHGEAGTLSVVISHWCPVVIVRQLLVMCCLLFACYLPITCCLLFACRFLFTCRLLIMCHLSSCVVCLHMSLSSSAVNGWWCWVFAASHGAGPPWPFMAGGVVTSLCHGWVVRRHRCHPWGGHSPFPSTHARAWLVCYPTIVLGLQTRSVRWGAMTMGWPLTFPSAHIPYVAWALYPACTVILGLQTRLVRWGVMTTGGRSLSQAPSHVCGMGTPPVCCPACTFVHCIERHANEGRQ